MTANVGSVLCFLVAAQVLATEARSADVQPIGRHWVADEDSINFGRHGMAAGAGIVVVLDGTTLLKALDGSGNPLWQAPLDNARSNPVVAGDTVYVSDDDALRAWDLDGAERWVNDEHNIYNRASPVVGGNIYAAGQAFNPADGSFLWEVHLSESSVVFSAADENAVYGGDGENAEDPGPLYAYNGTDGALLWERNLGGLLLANPTIDGDTLYVSIGGDAPALYALNTANAAIRWRVPMNGEANLSSTASIAPVVIENAVYFVSGNTVFALDAASGAEISRFQAGSAIEQMALGDHLLVGTDFDDRTLYALKPEDLSVAWLYRLDSWFEDRNVARYRERITALAANGPSVFAAILGEGTGSPVRMEAFGPTSIEVADISVSTATATVGDTVTATALVSNTGDVSVDYSVTFAIDGPLTPSDPEMVTVTGTLGANADEQVVTEVPMRHSGDYSVIAYETGRDRFEPDPRPEAAVVEVTRGGIDDPSWGHIGYDASGSGYNPNTSGPAGPMQQVWRRGDEVNLALRTEPVLGDNHTFIRTRNHGTNEIGVTALGLDAGEVNWSITHARQIGGYHGDITQHVYHDGVVYYTRVREDEESAPDDPDDPNDVHVVEIYAVAAATGAQLWSTRLEEVLQPTRLTVDDDNVYFFAQEYFEGEDLVVTDSVLYSLKRGSGDVNFAFRFDTGGQIPSTVSSSRGRLLYVVEIDDQTRLYSRDASSLDATFVTFDRAVRSFSVYDDVVYIGTEYLESGTVEESVGQIYALDTINLSTLWTSAPTELTVERGGRDQARSIVPTDTHVFVASGASASLNNQALYALDPQTGAVDWYVPTAQFDPLLAVADGVLYTVTARLAARDPYTGEVFGVADYHELGFDGIAVADGTMVATRIDDVVAWRAGARPIVSDLSFSSQDVTPGETVTVSAEISNPGILPTEIRVEFLRPGPGSARKDIDFAPGETQTVSFDFEAPPGDTGLAFTARNRDLGSNDTGDILVESPWKTLSSRELPAEPTGVFVREAEVLVEQLIFSRDGPGEELSARATASNVGSSQNSTTLDLIVDGDVVASREVTLAPGASEVITFGEYEAISRSYSTMTTATVNGVAAGSFLAIRIDPRSLPENTIQTGQSVTLEVRVYKAQGLAAETVLKMEADGTVVGQAAIELPAGTNLFDYETYEVEAAFMQAGTYEITVNGVEVSGSPLTVAGEPIEGFAAWLAQHFTEEERENPERVDPYGDPGGYGISNILRYAFALDPRQPEAADLPTLTFEPSGTEGEAYAVLTYPQLIEPNDLRYEVQASADMEEWKVLDGDFVIEEVTEIEGLVKRISVRDSVSMTEAQRRFLRVVVDWGSE